ncbi:MAG: DegV family protein [Defluviitaleaceae bacterium]|nr:DegV family protein [Defluviitaleaceae bacterium]
MSYSYEIITDSSCSLHEDYIEDNGIHILSLEYIINGVSKPAYVRGQKFDYKAFYDTLRKKVKASTSQVNYDQAYNLAKPLLEAGQDVIYIGFSSALSGTYQSTQSALEELRGEFPDRKILYEDSLTASVGYGHFLVAKAVEMRAAGASIEEVHQYVKNTKMHVDIFMVADDLFHLQRGGRLSAPAAFFGTLLGVKPVISVDNNGKLTPHAKVRGRAKALDYLVDKVAEKAKTKDQIVHIIHSDALDDAKALAEKIKTKCGIAQTAIYNLEPVIGVHTGPGVCAVIFLANSRG